MTYYIVNDKGEVYFRNGWLFSSDMSKAKTYKREKNATECAEQLARYYRMHLRVCNLDGQDVKEFGVKA